MRAWVASKGIARAEAGKSWLHEGDRPSANAGAAGGLRLAGAAARLYRALVSVGDRGRLADWYLLRSLRRHGPGAGRAHRPHAGAPRLYARDRPHRALASG